MQRLSKIGSLASLPGAWRPLFSTRTLAAVEHRAIIDYLRPQTVLDVGANKGQFSLLVRSLLPETAIWAFEPLASEADIFARNFDGDDRCTLYRFALSDTAGTAEFHIADRPDSSSLLSIGEGQRSAYGVGEARTVSVEVKRLDEIVMPDKLAGRVMLKIDVQGAEHMVLRGATGILPQVDFVYLEASFVELYDGQKLAGDMVVQMDELGFALRAVGSKSDTRQFGATQADLLFIRKGLPFQEPG